MNNKIIGFFDPVTISAIGSLAGGVGSVLGATRAGPAQLDTSAAQLQRSRESQATTRLEGARGRAQRAAEVQTQQLQQSDQRRADALDRIIGQFQQTLQV